MRLTQEEGVVVGGRAVVTFVEDLVVQWVGGEVYACLRLRSRG